MPSASIQNNHFDVVICGGGVAGCATAIALMERDPTLKIVIIEKSLGQAQGAQLPASSVNYSHTSTTSCTTGATLHSSTEYKYKIGESLPPHTFNLLNNLNLWQGFIQCDFAKTQVTSAIWGSDHIHHNESFFSAFGNGWTIDRAKFDRWLLNEAQSRGVVIIHGASISDSQFLHNAWKITVEQKANSRPSPLKLEASILVDASGTAAKLACRQGAVKHKYDALVGVYAFLKACTPGQSADPYSSLVEAHKDGWWYSTKLPNNMYLACLFSDADIIKSGKLSATDSWLKHLRNTQHTFSRLNQFGSINDLNTITVKSMAAQTQCLDKVCGEAWYAVGDAASCFDPLSALGMFKAIKMASVAAFAIVDTLAGKKDAAKKYQFLATSEFTAYLDKRSEYYQTESRFCDSLFWQRRHLHPLSMAG